MSAGTGDVNFAVPLAASEPFAAPVFGMVGGKKRRIRP